MNSKVFVLCVCLLFSCLPVFAQNGPNVSNYAGIADGAVTEPKIGSNAVTETKIADGAVTEAKIASDAVTTTKIADTNITEAKLHADVGIIRAIATGTILAATSDIVVSIAASKINTAAPKFILRVGGVEHIYPHNHAISSVIDDGTDITITLTVAVASDRSWSLLTLSDNL
jgi:hypothetical protein